VGGIYTWQVIALDENSMIICTAKQFTFEKPAYVSPQNNGDGEDGDGIQSGGGGPLSLENG
jgi:hypothetical protein